jgi:hypothetical protein
MWQEFVNSMSRKTCIAQKGLPENANFKQIRQIWDLIVIIVNS